MRFFKGLSRPVRLAGVVLIGVAVVAVAIGTVTATTGGSSQTAAPAAEGTTSPAPPPVPSAAPSAVPAPPTASSAPPATSAQAPGAAQAPASAPENAPAGQTDAKWVPVRVYNNSTIKGLAAQAADEFRAEGWNITETGNYPYGIIPHSTAYYTPGTDEETAAKALAAAFSMRAEPRFAGIENSSPGVIVILTNDFQGKGKD